MVQPGAYSLTRTLLFLFTFICLQRSACTGVLTPKLRAWLGEPVSASPINGDELAVYTICLRAQHGATYLHVKFPEEIASLPDNVDRLQEPVTLQIDIGADEEGCFEVGGLIRNPEGRTVTGSFSLWTSNETDPYINTPIDAA